MFVGYENFSTYFVDTDDAVAADTGNNDGELRMPTEYEFEVRPSDPWFNNSACDDFVILAEFYELEGPLPRVSIKLEMCNTLQNLEKLSHGMLILRVNNEVCGSYMWPLASMLPVECKLS